MPEVIKIGVVGAARILPAHLNGFKMLWDSGFRDFRITAICSRRIEDCQMFRKRGEGPTPRPSVISKVLSDPLNAAHMYVSDIHDDVLPELYTDWNEMIGRADVDAVLVLSTLHLHHQVALDALRAGKHVLLEKPYAISVKAGQAMNEEARRRGLSIGVAELIRYWRECRLGRWVMDSGLIGGLQMWLSGGMGFPDWSPDAIVGKTPWRHKKLLGGGGPAVDGAVHMFDWIRYVCGEIDEISAIAPTVEPQRYTRDSAGKVLESVDCEVDDAFFANMKFRNGAVGTIFGGVAGHGEPTGMRDGIAIYGSKGCFKGGEIVLDDGQRFPADQAFREGVPREQLDKWFPRGIEDGFALELLDFLRSIEHNRPMECDGEEAVKDLACSFAVLESAALKRTVAIRDVLDGTVDTYQREINEHYGL